MTTPSASRAGRTLSRQRHRYPITCQVCGERAVMRHPAARVCRKRACRQEMDTRRRRLARQTARQKEAQQ